MFPRKLASRAESRGFHFSLIRRLREKLVMEDISSDALGLFWAEMDEDTCTTGGSNWRLFQR